MLTFRTGPNNWCTEELARERGYKRYVPTAADLAREKVARTVTVRTKAGVQRPIPAKQAAPPKPAAPTVRYDKLAPAPAGPAVPLVHMSGLELRAYSAELDEWLTEHASRHLSVGDRLRFEMVQERADEAFVLSRMAR